MCDNYEKKIVKTEIVLKNIITLTILFSIGYLQFIIFKFKFKNSSNNLLSNILKPSIIT